MKRQNAGANSATLLGEAFCFELSGNIGAGKDVDKKSPKALPWGILALANYPFNLKFSIGHQIPDS